MGLFVSPHEISSEVPRNSRPQSPERPSPAPGGDHRSSQVLHHLQLLLRHELRGHEHALPHDQVTVRHQALPHVQHDRGGGQTVSGTFNDQVKSEKKVCLTRLFYTDFRLLVKTLLTPCSGLQQRRGGRRESTSA